MSNIIDTIQVSGVTYTIAGSGGGSGNSVVEVTQAQYDAMVSGGTVDPTILYIITDAQAGDLTQYWTSAQTQSAITEATSGKVDTSDFSTYSASVETALSDKVSQSDFNTYSASVETTLSGKASQSDLETVSGQVANKQDTLVSGTNIKTINNESLLGSGNIIIQGGGGGTITIDPSLDSGSTNAVANSAITVAVNSKVNIADNNVSGFTYEAKLKEYYDYGDAFTGPIWIKYNGYSGDEGSMFVGQMYIYLSQNSTSYVYLYFDILNGTITGTSTSSEYITITIQDGEATIIPASGCYFQYITTHNNFNAYSKIIYSSGQSANVIEDTVYPMFDNLKSEFGKAINFVSTNLNNTGAIVTNYKTIDGGDYSNVAGNITSSTINAEGNVLNVQFETPEAGQKILNAGSGGFCSLFSKSYNNGYADLTITFNSGYTGGITSNSRYNIGLANSYSSPIYYSAFYNPSTSAFTYESDLTDYCTITDTISTDNKVKITSNEGYRITYFYNNDCSIGGVDTQYPENYIVTLVTTTSNIQNGQNVIDDIYSTLSGKQDTLSAGTGIDITNNVISATGGGGGSITIDPTLDSGSTNAVANSAITTALNTCYTNGTYWDMVGTPRKNIPLRMKKYGTNNFDNVTLDLGSNLVYGSEGFQTLSVSGVVETSAITSAITSSSTDAQVPSAKAVYESVSGKVDTSSMSGYVTTDTAQEITGEKTFVGEKKLKFKQSGNSSKIGFTLYNSASTNNELATFEFRPDTYTDSSSVKHPLLYLGHYRNTNTANAGVVQTMVGFRQYDQSGGAAYHYLMPLPSEAKTPFSLTTSFKNYFAPLGFKNGSTMITADNTGVADFSDVLGGLKLVKLTQTEYDNLSTKDSNTLYVIVN